MNATIAPPTTPIDTAPGRVGVVVSEGSAVQAGFVGSVGSVRALILALPNVLLLVLVLVLDLILLLPGSPGGTTG